VGRQRGPGTDLQEPCVPHAASRHIFDAARALSARVGAVAGWERYGSISGAWDQQLSSCASWARRHVRYTHMFIYMYNLSRSLSLSHTHTQYLYQNHGVI